MRLLSARVVLVLVAITGIAGLPGCKSGSKKRSGTTTAATNSGTTGGTTSGSTSPTNTGSTAPTNTGTGTGTGGGLPAGGGTAGGGNTSSGGSNTGATPSGFAGGTGRFVDATVLLPDSMFQDYGADATDLDGDGDVDIAIASRTTNSRVLFNNGAAGFAVRAGAFPAVSMQANDVRAVDVDADRDMDLLFASNFEPVRLFTNNGQGVFTLAQEFNTGNDCFTYNLAIGDVDGDGDEDVLCVNAGQNTVSRGQEKLFLNTAGRFAEAPAGRLPARLDDSLDATFLDVDGDGDKDIFIANFGAPHSLYINNGTGTFVNQSDVWIPATLAARGGTAVGQGDLDRDGKIDLYVANEGLSVGGALPAGEKNTLLLQGTGRFTDESTRLPAETDPSFAVRLVDVNGDGWQDALVSNLRQVQRLYLNNQGVFVDATANLPSPNAQPYDSLGLCIGDFNGDRAPDVLFTRRGQKPWLFLNVP